MKARSRRSVSQKLFGVLVGFALLGILPRCSSGDDGGGQLKLRECTKEADCGIGEGCSEHSGYQFCAKKCSQDSDCPHKYDCSEGKENDEQECDDGICDITDNTDECFEGSSSDEATTGGDSASGSQCDYDSAIDAGEQCDTATLPYGATCSSLTMGAKPVGSLWCNACVIMLDQCQSAAPAPGTGGGGGL